MAKNITLMGANYPDVPAVILPQTGGGSAKFVDADQIGNFRVVDIGVISNTSKEITFAYKSPTPFILVSFGGSNERHGMWLCRASSSAIYIVPILPSQYVSLSSQDGQLTITTTASGISFYALVCDGTYWPNA